MRFRNQLHFLRWKACQCCVWFAGEAACAFGKSYEVEHDLSTPTGFELALRLAWGCASAGVSGRRRSARHGCGLAEAAQAAMVLAHLATKSRPAVAQTNRMVDNVCVLLLVALLRDCHAHIEQPLSSLLPKHPRLL